MKLDQAFAGVLGLLIAACLGNGCGKSKQADAQNQSVSADDNSFDSWQKRAKGGDVRAQTILGQRYLLGEGVETNRTESRKWFRKAADQGDANAQMLLAGTYSQSDPDQREAAKWLLKAAEQDHGMAQLGLGLKYALGEGVPKDVVEGLKWMSLAVMKDVNGAKEDFDETSQLVTKDQRNEAQRRAAAFRPTLSAKSINNGQDEYLAAKLLLEGENRSPEATRLLEAAKSAANHLFVGALVSSDTRSDSQPVQEMIKAQQRFDDLKSFLEKKEAKTALALLNQAVAWKHPRAMLLLSQLIMEGKRAPKNMKRGFELDHQAAELGEAEGMGALGIDYAKGDGIEKDLNEAVRWLEKACEQGQLRAHLVLATILLKGGINADDGYPKDYEKAYALSRALQLIEPPQREENKWADNVTSEAKQHLQVEQLLGAERVADKIAARLRELLGLNQGEATQVRTEAKTKAQWKGPHGRILGARGSRNAFIRSLGTPNKTQTVDDFEYWYYQFPDGLVQVKIANPSHGDNDLVVFEVNDY